MIKIRSWKSQKVETINLDNEKKPYTVAFTDHNEHDDRSDWTLQYLESLANKVMCISYCPLNVSIQIGSQSFGIRELENFELVSGRVLVDATSLALPELLHIFSLLNKNKRSFDVVYVQPTDYNEKRETGIDKVVSFDLSEDGLGIQQVPPYIGMSTNSNVFFFLGWEGHRLGALINSDEFDTNNMTCLMGTPPFRLGWENVTLSNNYRQMLELCNSSNVRFKHAGANDPVRTYELIEKIHESSKYDRRSLCLAPFGTKPAAIAAAQFATNNSNVVILYDYVQKVKKRSSGTDLVHLWEFRYSE
ncbi:conserved hypothetical protein [Alteromonas macleodii]